MNYSPDHSSPVEAMANDSKRFGLCDFEQVSYFKTGVLHGKNLML